MRIKIVIIIAIIAVHILGINNAAAKELVLVSSNATNYQTFSKLEIKKLFLGYPMIKNSTKVQAIRNLSDQLSYQIFLQNIISMSAKNYERRLMSKTFRTGTTNVSLQHSLSQLKQQLIAQRSHVSVMWRHDILEEDKLKIVQVLWSEH
ncbi:MAG: hypothetical protein HRU25_04725 [Psychrobium sp.]|nr:hypothetical protein [Psychrobium sp.]